MVDGEEKADEADGKCDHAREQENQSGKDKPANSDKLNQHMSYSNILTLIFTALLVVSAFLTFSVICVQALIYGFQLKEMRKSTQAATKAAKAAETSVEQARETARLDQRAWVGVIDVSGNPTLNQPFIVTVQAKNTGKTFAKKLRSYVYFQSIPAGVEPNFSPDNDHPPGGQSITLVAPGGDYKSQTDVLDEQEIKTVTQAQLDDWKSGKKVFFVSGKLFYEDIFGCGHWTTCCFYLRRNLQGYSNYEKHNDADDNRCP